MWVFIEEKRERERDFLDKVFPSPFLQGFDSKLFEGNHGRGL
jgi:hypothetical protein